MNAPRLLAHGDHPPARQFGRREVQMRHLGESVADLVVDGALADFAAFDVRHGDTQCECHRRRSQHLVAIGDQQQQVRAATR